MFPFKWLGGKQTLKQFKNIIESKKGVIGHMVSIEWKSKKREKIILDMLNEFNIKKSAT